MNRKQLTQVTDDKYVAEDGATLQREEGLTPNGNQLGGKWVYRDAAGEMLAFDQYRSDIAEEFYLELWGERK